MQDLKARAPDTDDRCSEPSADPKPETGQVEVNEPAPEAAAKPDVDATKTGASEDVDDGPEGTQYLAFEKMIKSAIAESAACPACRMAVLTEIMADEICGQTTTVEEFMSFGNAVTTGIKKSAVAKLSVEKPSRPSGYETTVFALDIGPISPMATEILKSALRGDLRI